MKGLKNIVFSFLFLLILGSNIIASTNQSTYCSSTNSSKESIEVPVIYAPVHPIYLEIEVNNFTQTITEFHRLGSMLVLSNRIVPLNYNFRRIESPRNVINFSSPVSIFIKGHALLN